MTDLSSERGQISPRDPPGRLLHITQLRALDACPHYVAMFRSKFGSKVYVTPELCAEHAEDFNWEWASCRLLGTTKEREWCIFRDQELDSFINSQERGEIGRRKYFRALATEFGRLYAESS